MSAAQRGPVDPRGILRARAERLARPAVPERAAGEMLPVLQFSLQADQYAFPLAAVDEVLGLPAITPLPCTPVFVAGITNVRGRFLAVVDLRRLLGLREQGTADFHHLVVVRHGPMQITVLADLIAGIRQIERAALQVPGPAVTSVPPGLLLGIAADGLRVLDAAGVLGAVSQGAGELSVERTSPHEMAP